MGAVYWAIYQNMKLGNLNEFWEGISRRAVAGDEICNFDDSKLSLEE